MGDSQQTMSPPASSPSSWENSCIRAPYRDYDHRQAALAALHGAPMLALRRFRQGSVNGNSGTMKSDGEAVADHSVKFRDACVWVADSATTVFIGAMCLKEAYENVPDAVAVDESPRRPCAHRGKEKVYNASAGQIIPPTLLPFVDAALNIGEPGELCNSAGPVVTTKAALWRLGNDRRPSDVSVQPLDTRVVGGVGDFQEGGPIEGEGNTVFGEPGLAIRLTGGRASVGVDARADDQAGQSDRPERPPVDESEDAGPGAPGPLTP